jgi:tRNA (guanine37-N1)-methyltransferase
VVIKIITLFPEFFKSPLGAGLMGKAVHARLLDVQVVDLRQFGEGNYRQCDDYPYGGGSGMVLMPGPLFKAIRSVRGERTRVVLPSASGKPLTQQLARELSGEKDLCLVCGHYEGIDQRVVDSCVSDEISIGDYVLSGGEYAALVIMDSIVRLIPGFMSNRESLLEESFVNGLLEYPQYTRPNEIEGLSVPEVLLSGDHARIRQWRLEQSVERTRKIRPDLYQRYAIKKQGEER